MSQPKQAAVSDSEVREQLEKVLAHPLFARSGRMGRFLRLAVERTLEGKAEDLKEYFVGVEVFDRKPSYDPRVDPIVRVEARRLRSKLKAYYEGEGRGDAIAIDFPTGSYAPRFRAAALRDDAPAAPGAITTAVLPFVNLGPDTGNEYFSDGLTEELIHALTKLPGLRVVAWSTAARMRDRQEDIAAIGRQLKVGTVLTGSVRIAGASLRVRAQLIDTTSGVYLWSETFDRTMQDIFAIQEEIAQAIVRTLRVQFGGARQRAPIARAGMTVGSYDWYLRGRHLMHSRTPENLIRGVEAFERAIAADAGSALAWAGLADACTLLAEYGVMCPAEGLAKAKAAAERSIALDPELAEPYASLGLIKVKYEWDWEGAERMFRRSIALSPSYATAHHWLAVDLCAVVGRFEEAMDGVTIALQLDPLSGIILEGHAYTLLLMRRYEDAIAGYSEILTFDPSFYKAYTSMGRAYGLMGRYPEAIAMLEKGRSLAGDLSSILAAMGQLHAVAGDQASALAMLEKLERQREAGYVPGSCFALVHMGLGDRQRALDLLEKACDLRESPVTGLKMHPIYDPLRGEPRFQALLARVFGKAG